MKLEIKFKNGQTEIKEVSKLDLKKKNPCINCRKDGGCYDHGCFMPEDWGDFLVSRDHEIRVQDVETIKVIQF
ncbi:MAG: hypothetical protein K6C97_07000 [Treponema sp.]|nr:hypothetical protein [Treponema sp.]